MVKIILLYLTLVSCGYIIQVLPEEPTKPAEPVKVHAPPPAKVHTHKTPEIDRHEPAPIEEKEEVKKEKSLVPLPPKG